MTWDTGALLSGLTSGRSELRVDGRHAERETGEDWGGPREAGESHSEHPGGSGSCYLQYSFLKGVFENLFLFSKSEFSKFKFWPFFSL